ncbi:protein of unknown function [Moritella yayanosii]|uniref:Uncharacterized protein n=1 Tax=Moritella yayanosii TaxID=69539 RepID=A0A330LNU0_9GAMM|nr:protein of unknown function [Moritella yayanosii]
MVCDVVKCTSVKRQTNREVWTQSYQSVFLLQIVELPKGKLFIFFENINSGGKIYLFAAKYLICCFFLYVYKLVNRVLLKRRY